MTAVTEEGTAVDITPEGPPLLTTEVGAAVVAIEVATGRGRGPTLHVARIPTLTTERGKWTHHNTKPNRLNTMLVPNAHNEAIFILQIISFVSCVRSEKSLRSSVFPSLLRIMDYRHWNVKLYTKLLR